METLQGLIIGIVVLFLIDRFNIWFQNKMYGKSSGNNGTNKKENAYSITNTKCQNNNYAKTQNNKKNTNWLIIKDEVFEKYGRKCVNCGATENIDVHHKIPLSEGGTNCLDNLIPLCRNCHEKLHNFKMGKNDNTKIDFQYGTRSTKDKKAMIGYKICDAIEKGYRIKIKYKSGKADNEKITERIIRPLEIQLGSESQNKLINNSKYNQNKSFLRAFCELRKEERLFRLDRIIDVIEIYNK